MTVAENQAKPATVSTGLAALNEAAENNAVASALKKQLKLSAERDTNPLRLNGRRGEMASRFAHFFREADQLANLAVKVAPDGWISGQSLETLAELAQRHSCGLMEFLALENNINLLGVKASAFDTALDGLAYAGWQHVDNGFFLGIYNRQSYEHASQGLDEEMKTMWKLLNARLAAHSEGWPRTDFRLELIGHAGGCISNLEFADMAMVGQRDQSTGAPSISLWVGGAFAPFKTMNEPWLWKKDLPAGDYDALIKINDKVFEALDWWKMEGLAGETLPQTAARLPRKAFAYGR